ncbi:MAG: hypothetical protein H6807_10965 [Planctomycetes bacterium]|nr:hypothetical protein [Planctomycetota bacterium]
MRILAIVFLSVLLVACASEQRGREGYYSGLRPIGEARPESQASPAWMNPRTLQVHAAIDRPEEGELILRGLLIGHHFRATGDVEGSLTEPEVRARCRKVDLMLRDRRLIDEGSPRPAGDYLPGLFDPETELFHPSTRVVVRAPVEPAPES